MTHVQQSNTTAQRDNLNVLDLLSEGLWRKEYEFIGCTYPPISPITSRYAKSTAAARLRLTAVYEWPPSSRRSVFAVVSV